jgi:hypothetical protein
MDLVICMKSFHVHSQHLPRYGPIVVQAARWLPLVT